MLSRDARSAAQEKRNELAAKRKAFCAAVEAAQNARSATFPAKLIAQCGGLSGDLMAMPTATMRAINEIGDPEPKLQYGASFAEGAAVLVAAADRAN